MCLLLRTYIVCNCPQQNDPICPHHNNLRENQPDAGAWQIRRLGPDGRDDWFVRLPDEEQTCDKWSPFETKWEPCATYLSKPEHWREDGTLVRWFEVMCKETAYHKVKSGIDGHEKNVTIRILCPLCFRGHGDDQLRSGEGGNVTRERARSRDRSTALARDGEGAELLTSVLSSDITIVTRGLDKISLGHSPRYLNEDSELVDNSSATKEEDPGAGEEDDGCLKKLTLEATPVQEEEAESKADSDATEGNRS